MPCDLGLQLALRVECVLPLKVTKSALNDNSCTHKCTKLYHDISRIDWVKVLYPNWHEIKVILDTFFLANLLA